ncbi:MAG TPA: amino acid adenylation domain-containing protein, partial [Longimicrobium sp.]
MTVSNESAGGPSRSEKQEMLRRILLEKMSRTRTAPVSFAQERLWFLDRLQPDSALYNIPAALRLSGPLDVPALERALGEVVRRHEALRTTFSAEGDVPVQVIAPFAGFALPVEDLAGAAHAEAEARRRAAGEAARPFDLGTGPLFRATLLRLAADEHLLLLCMHHIVSDGWSLGVLQGELAALYDAFREGRPSPLPELSVQYAGYAAWQREHLRGEVLEGALAYWRGRLAGAPELLELPLYRPRPAAQSFRGAHEPIHLPAALVARLEALGRREGATLYMVLLAAFQLLLGRYAGSEDVVVGSPIAGRTRGEVEGLIGFFVNLLALRTDLSGDPDVRGLLRRVREVTLGAYEHQDVPFEKLVEALRPERSMAHAALCQATFALQELDAPAPTLAGVRTEPVEVLAPVAKFDLTLGLAPDGAGGLRGELEYATDLFDRATAARMTAHLRRVLEQFAADPDARLSELELLDAGERRTILEEWNRTDQTYPSDRSIQALFEAQAADTPDAPAVAWEGGSLAYAALNARANRLARHLLRLGVGADVRVGICLERGAEMVVAMLAVLKAGGAYVPLDPGYPAERLAFMVADSGAAVLITRDALRGTLSGAPVVSVDGDAGRIASEDASNPPSASGPGSLAYVIYTSGSTGTPKGVAAEHRGVVRLVRDTDYVDVRADDRIAQASTASFDAATFEIWGALLNGASTVMIARDAALLPADLARAIRAQGITTLFLTTALFNHVAREVPDAFHPLRTLLFGGEAVDPGAVRTVLAAGGPERLLHVYGPTENTTFSTWHRVDAVPAGAQTVPIGRALAHSTAFVLDRAGRPVPAGVAGELFVGGDGLARGYLGRPALTAERFVPDPFASTPGARMYRTGDRVRWVEEGSASRTGVLEYLGRFDEQVKIRGFRIEPGEVESVLAAHPDVREARVVVREDAPGEKRLVAYVAGGMDVDALRAHLRRTLPEHMVPAAVVRMDALPISPNGKVDRRALPVPDLASAEDAHLAPRTPAEEVLAGIWAEVLGVARVGAADDFFVLGGHSLLATRLVSRIRSVFAVELPLRAVFEDPTVLALAARVDALRRADGPQLPAVIPAAGTGPAPLSFAQERLWFLDRLQPG